MEIFFNYLIYGGLAWGIIGLVRHLIHPPVTVLYSPTRKEIECKTFPGWHRNAPPPDYVPDYEKLPDIEKDPLAIEINRAWAKHNGHMYISPICSYDEIMDAIFVSRSIVREVMLDRAEAAATFDGLIDSGETTKKINVIPRWAKDKDSAM